MKTLLMKIFRIRFLLQFLKFYNKSQKEGGIVLFIPRMDFTYFLRTNFLWDLATLIHLNESGKTYQVKVGLKRISSILGRKVIYNPGYNLNDWNIENDVAFFPLLSQILENQANVVIPTSSEIIFWENKSFMYNQFISKNIDMPDTHVISKDNLHSVMAKIDDNSKWLYKPNHSKSSIGIVEIKTDFESFVMDKLQSNKYVVVQKIIDIERDCRIIVINDEVILQYWRNKVQSESWIPTSTSTGSTVTFMNYPESLEKWVVNSTKKLGLKSAAWDVVFDKNDSNLSRPMALEVSPVYYPNPRENYDPNKSYVGYKKKLIYEKYLLNEFKTHISAKLMEWTKDL